MNKKALCKMSIVAFIMFGILLIMKTDSNAASLSISPSKTSVSPGESFTITVSVSGGAGKVNLKASNATLNATELELMLQSSRTVTCTAGSSGTITISATGDIADYTTEIDEKKSASVSININAVNNTGNTSGGGTTTASTNANLSNLGITPNDFTGFTPNKTSYSVNVPNEVSQITIYANKGHSGQTISGTGTKTLKEGTNKFSITVKAVAGNTKTYTISVNRATLDGEDVPNAGDENAEETEEQSNGITLDGLEIEGFELEPAFDPTIKEYTVKVNKTFTSLDEIRELVKTVMNDENYIIEVLTEGELKENNNIVTVIIKDSEKEYARYTITFVNEEEQIKSGEKTEINNDTDDSSTFTIFGYEFDKNLIPVFIMLGCTILAISIGILLAIIAFVKSKKLKEYEEDEYFDDNEEENDESKDIENGVEGKEDILEESNEEQEKEPTFKRQGYRSQRKKGKNAGRHF